MQKPDLNKLKTEISNRKKELVSNVGNPRNKFLTELYESVNSGKESTATVMVKKVDNLVSERKNEKTRLPIKENVKIFDNQTPILPKQSVFQNDLSEERENELWREMERRSNETLANSLEKYSQSSIINNQKQVPQINDDLLNQKIKTVIDNYLIESFTPIVEETIKSTILELYAVERIKEVLNENKGIVKEIVYDVIRELQRKTKTK